MNDYKGVYYNDDSEKKFYEFGAHFKYSELVKILLNLGGKFLEYPIIENNKIKKQNLLEISPEIITRNKVNNQFKLTKLKPLMKSFNNENNSQINLISNFNIKNSNYNFNKYFINFNNKNFNNIFHTRNNSNLNNNIKKNNNINICKINIIKK